MELFPIIPICLLNKSPVWIPIWIFSSSLSMRFFLASRISYLKLIQELKVSFQQKEVIKIKDHSKRFGLLQIKMRRMLLHLFFDLDLKII